jgi:very-short-patch-repair endonuclease
MDIDITVGRFNNQQFYDNLDGVLTEIAIRLENITDERS